MEIQENAAEDRRKFLAFRARILRKIMTPAQRERERRTEEAAKARARAERAKVSQRRKAARLQRRADAVKARRAADPAFALQLRVRSLVNNAFRRRGALKSDRTEQILGCTLTEFFAHIERQFLPGMTWENRHLWHIDHIVALATAATEAEVLALNHFTNLRPLWGPDNIAKGAQVLNLI